MKQTGNHVPNTPEKIHTEQVIIRILLPVLFAVLVCLAVVSLLVFSPASISPGVEQWAQISTILLIFHELLLGLFLFAILFFACRLIMHWNAALPPLMLNLRLSIDKIGRGIQKISTKTADPFIFLKSINTGFKTLLSKVRKQK
jgi:hypothetical protein